MGTAAHATHFVVFFALAGLVLLLRAMDSDRAATFFWSGVLFGIAFLMNQHGMFFAAFGAAWLAASVGGEGELGLGNATAPCTGG